MTASLRRRLRAGEPLTGVFVKTPSHLVLEQLALGPADVAVIDAEHASIGPAELDVLLAVAHGHRFSCLVRVPDASRAVIQQALDAGASGVVVPHVATPEQAADVVRRSHYGPGGRGYAGSTRSAGWGRRPMADVVRTAREETVVVVQLEDRECLASVDAIVAVEGVDAAFVGVADLAVALGVDDPHHPDVEAAVDAILAAAERAGVARAAFAGTDADVDAWRARGVTFVCAGSDHTRLAG